ncbi:MAG: hypothetical protein J6S96_04195 [Muribaculaceae bacterium]|nr:hypothetical protein [Muribaculaceae bacterium]
MVKKALWLIMCVVAMTSCHSDSELVRVHSTEEVIAYYPAFSRIDLVCGNTMPSQDDQNVIFCAEAAFTHDLLDHFEHANIDGDHVSAGQRYQGAQCRDNSGAFTWHGGKWHFIAGNYSDALDMAAQGGGMGFGQALIVVDGEAVTPLWRSGNNYYRALCEKDSKLCIVDSKESVDYDVFVAQLVRYGVTQALYLDMGSGWNHSWWRDAKGITHEIHPWIPKCMFRTNWITFYRQ